MHDAELASLLMITMAKRSNNMSKKGDNEKLAEPDFDAAAKILLGEISKSGDVMQKSAGDLSASWKKVEDHCHVNKKAAKDALKIHKMSQASQQDYLRSLIGMFAPLGLGISRDLVDAAQGVNSFSIPIIDIDNESELD